ncbi:MAG: sigma-54 dependent transcriptional regulator [Syntrophales bacterium]|nr:sigma-54 dependent transcriptional regulator [Syntrophales bacterium]
MNHKILLAEDEKSTRSYICDILEQKGYDVIAVSDGAEAIKAFDESDFELVLTDIMMPNANGFELLRHVRESGKEIAVVIMTGYGTTGKAVEAMHLGAFDFISKPCKPDLIVMTISRALSWMKLKRENVVLKDKLKDRYDYGKMIGYSDSMRHVFETIKKVAKMDSTVLIQGESGTGKELVARAIHYNSERRNGLLVPVNCGAIPAELLESELFGHEKGAFTGAIRTKIGRFEMAHGGTIFLDEIAEMSPMLQVKLLRVIQEKSFERVGGVSPVNVDIRIIAATNQDLENAMAERRFREDLFYRINVIPIHLPPLRERDSDVIILANHFLQKFNEKRNKPVKGFADGVVQILQDYQWPGNVRELENLIEMLIVMKDEGVIEESDLPPKIARKELKLDEESFDIDMMPGTYQDMVNMYEKKLLTAALEKTGGVKSRAAKLLKIKRTTLAEKVKKLGLEP